MSYGNKVTTSQKSNLLIGSGLFLLFGFCFNIRSNFKMNEIDLTVLIFGVVFFLYALIKKLKG